MGLVVVVAAALSHSTVADAVVITQHQTKEGAQNVFAWPGGVLVAGASPGGPVERVNSSPTFSLTPGTPGPRASEVTLGPDGNLWFLGGLFEKLPSGLQVEYSAIYEITATEVAPRYRYPTPFLEYPAAGEMVTGPDHALWIADPATGRIERYDPSTGNFSSYAVRGTPISIVSGPEDAMWFIDSDGYIGRITMQGEMTEHLIADGDTEGPLGFMQPYDITTGPDGALWFTEGNGRIGRMTPNWQLEEFDVPNPQGLRQGDGGPSPRYIVAGPDQAMWFTDPGDVAIGRVTMSGEVSEYAIPGSPEAVPTHIASGPEGLLWFTEENTTEIGSVSPDAAPTASNAVRVPKKGRKTTRTRGHCRAAVRNPQATRGTRGRAAAHAESCGRKKVQKARAGRASSPR